MDTLDAAAAMASRLAAGLSMLAREAPAMAAPPSATSDSPPSGCKPHHSSIETALSLFLCMGLVVSYLPQIVRIIWKKSSVGFSPWFLFLGATSSASSFLNVVSLQWAIVSCCQYLSYGACFESLLGIVQVGLQWLLFMIVFALFLIYYPKELRTERSIALSPDDQNDSESSEDDLDSIDSHIAQNYLDNGTAGDSSASGPPPSATNPGVQHSDFGGGYGSGGESAEESGIVSQITVDEEDERSSSAFSRLVPTFWPVWKAPRKYTPSPLSKATNNADNERQLPANATPQAVAAASAPLQTHTAPDSATTSAPEANGSNTQHQVRIQLPTIRRKRKGPRVRSQEWNLALSLAWLVAFHFVFILSVTLLLVSSLPANSFPQPPEAQDRFAIAGPSSRLLVNRWATFLGWSAMLLAAFQYLPQIVHTARTKLVGSLSIPMMCLQVPGSALFVYSLALKPGVNFTSLIAYICTGVLQAVLLGLCIAWRLRQHRLGIDDYGRPLTEESVDANAE